MTKKYGRWNNASFYPNCHMIRSNLYEYNTEKLLYGKPLHIHITTCCNNSDIRAGYFEMNILMRIAASHGLTRSQLINFLIMQGVEIDHKHLGSCLRFMVQSGLITCIKLKRSADGIEIVFYDLADRGIQLLRENELPCQSPADEYFHCPDTFRLIRNKVVSNQIVLDLLCHMKDIRSFFFQWKFNDKKLSRSLLFPLYIQTRSTNYIFEIVSNTQRGKINFQNQMRLLLQTDITVRSASILVLIAETHEHMKELSNLMVPFQKKGLGMEVLYTHDSEWFYENSGYLYQIAHTMGQTGMMKVHMI